VDAQTTQTFTEAVAPIVLVSAAGLLYNGMQTKNLHLSDRIRAMAAELRMLGLAPKRRAQVLAQLPFFRKGIRFSHRALELIYLAILCFILTSLLLAANIWIGPTALPAATRAIFAIGVILLIVALALGFVKMWIGLKTIEIELGDTEGR